MHPGLQPREIGRAGVAGAPAEQHPTQPEQAPADAARRPGAPGDALEVAQQVRPAHLAPLWRHPVVHRVAVRHQHAGRALARQRLRHVARPRGQHLVDHHLRLHRRPHPVPGAGPRLAPARLVHVQHRCAVAARRRLLHRCLQRLRHQPLRLRDRPQAEAHPQHLAQQRADLVLRQVVPRAQRPDQGQRPRPDLPARHPGRQPALVRLAAVSAHPAVQPVFLHLRPHRLRQVRHLVAPRPTRLDRPAALAHLGWRALVHRVDLALVQQRP